LLRRIKYEHIAIFVYIYLFLTSVGYGPRTVSPEGCGSCVKFVNLIFNIIYCDG
jgi:hypothetical protein